MVLNHHQNQLNFKLNLSAEAEFYGALVDCLLMRKTTTGFISGI